MASKKPRFCTFQGSVGSTNMNEHSSRSHAIFTITIERSEKGADGQQHVRMGKLHMVDLAVSLKHFYSVFLCPPSHGYLIIPGAFPKKTGHCLISCNVKAIAMK